jgi:hypothetical protein
MKTPNRLTQTVIGFLLALVFTSPVQAIPVVISADASWQSTKAVVESTKQTITQARIIASSEMTRIEQIAEHAKNVQRWANQVQLLTSQIMGDLKRFTTLKGMLGVVEEQLGLDDDTLKALADIGQTVRACFALKEQFESLVKTRLQMIQNLYTRARLGIFNPAQDLADLDEYLRSGIGRSAERMIQSRERLAALDNELETWIFELQQARKDLALRQTQLKEVMEKLKAEGELSKDIERKAPSENGDRTGPRLKYRENSSAEAITALMTNKTLLDGQIADLEKRVAELLEKINQRYQTYHLKFDESKARVSGYRRAVEGWEGMAESKEKWVQDLVNPYEARRTQDGQ